MSSVFFQPKKQQVAEKVHKAQGREEIVSSRWVCKNRSWEGLWTKYPENREGYKTNNYGYQTYILEAHRFNWKYPKGQADTAYLHEQRKTSTVTTNSKKEPTGYPIWTIFHEKYEQTLNYQTTVLVDDIYVVTKRHS